MREPRLNGREPTPGQQQKQPAKNPHGFQLGHDLYGRSPLPGGRGSVLSGAGLPVGLVQKLDDVCDTLVAAV